MNTTKYLFCRSFLALLSMTALALGACGGSDGGGIAGPAAPPPKVGTPDDNASTTEGSADGRVKLEVVLDGAHGSVRSEPQGIDCPGQCAATFDPSTTVTLTATAAEGWKLDYFGAEGESCAPASAASCTIPTLTKDTKVTSVSKQIDPRWDPSVGAIDCVAAWGNAGDKLSPCDTTPDDYVVVHKSKRNVALCKNGSLVKNFRSGLGFEPTGAKQKQGDGKTPEGVFYIPRLVPDSSYYKAFLLSYPTAEDAKRGAGAGLITKAQQAQIESAFAACTEPSQSTNLGGEVEIHGNGSSKDWTAGCVAVDDGSIDVLWSALDVHDTIVVLP